MDRVSIPWWDSNIGLILLLSLFIDTELILFVKYILLCVLSLYDPIPYIDVHVFELFCIAKSAVNKWSLFKHSVHQNSNEDRSMHFNIG